MSAKDPVAIDASVENTLFCKEPDGGYTFWATVRIIHTNTGRRPLIVPRLIAISGYRVENMSGKEILRVENVFDEMSAISIDVWNGVTPKQGLFDILKHSQSRGIGGMMLGVPISGGGGKHETTLEPGHYRLFIHVNHNERSSRPSVLSATRWPNVGVLLTETIEARPIEIRIPSTPPTETCKRLFKM